MDEAKLDLIAIRDYYLDAGGNQLALRMIKQIRSEIDLLQDYQAPPYELLPGIRRLVVAKGAFLVFHRVNEVDAIIEVLHVRRAERKPATGKDLNWN